MRNEPSLSFKIFAVVAFLGLINLFAITALADTAHPEMDLDRVVLEVYDTNNNLTDSVIGRDWELKNSRFFANGYIAYQHTDDDGTKYIKHFKIINGKIVKLGKGVTERLQFDNAPKPGYIMTTPDGFQVVGYE